MTRLALIADVHANLPALEAAVALLRREEVDAYVCAGDLVGYGPYPNECVEAVRALGAVCVVGNHDLIALGRLSDERCIPLARASLRWTRETLCNEARTYLESLPRRARVDSVVIAHGSLDDPQEYSRRPEQAEAQLATVAGSAQPAKVLVLGHTHRVWAYRRGVGTATVDPGVTLSLGEATWLLNPGAVGQSRDFRALVRVAVLDLERRSVTFHATRYDIRRCRSALRHVGLSTRGCHLRPSPARAGKRLLGTLGGVRAKDLFRQST